MHVHDSLDRYFDYNGSTPLAPEVRALCAELLDGPFGNSAAAHPQGRAASERIERARAQVAAMLGAEPSEVIFTSGGTESNNHALFGTAALHAGGHLVVSAMEHKSVLNAALALEQRGFELTLIRPGADGAVRVEDYEAALRDDTRLVSLMWTNNETGVCQPVRELAELCRERGVRFHTDAVCALGKVPVDVREVPCDLLSLSGHKLYSPKGIGVLYRRAGVELEPLLHGCGHQGGLRSGTENTTGTAAFGLACELHARGELKGEHSTAELRAALWTGIREALPEALLNGGAATIPNTLSVCFPGASATAMQAALAAEGFSVSAGASASTGAASHVLLAMGCSPEHASESLRFSLGRWSTPAGVQSLLEHLCRAVETCRTPSTPVSH